MQHGLTLSVAPVYKERGLEFVAAAGESGIRDCRVLIQGKSQLSIAKGTCEVVVALGESGELYGKADARGEIER